MILYSTQQKSSDVSFEEAIFRGLPPDNGLYMPTEIQHMPAAFFEQIHTMTLPEIAEAVCQNLLGHDLSPAEIKSIITSSMTFEAPLFDLEPGVQVLELFHGPSMAFKDFWCTIYGGGNVALFAETPA
jgi:threonine synthase